MATVVDMLRKTDKGQLKYYNNWSPKDLLQEEPKIPVIHQELETVFEIKSIRAALEAIDDDAYEFVADLKEEEVRETFRAEESKEKSKEGEYSDGNYNFFSNEHALQDWEQSIEEENRRLENRENDRRRQNLFDEIARETLQAAICRREQEKRAREEQIEKEKRFYEYLQESSKKIRENMQKHQDAIIRTRHQQEQERKLRLQLLEKQRQKEAYEKFTKMTQEIRTICAKMLSKSQNFDRRNSPEFLQSQIPLQVEKCRQILNFAANALATITSPEILTIQHTSQAEDNLQLVHLLQNTLEQKFECLSKIIKLREFQEREQQELVAKQQKEVAEAEQQRKKETPKTAAPKQAISPSEEHYQKLKLKIAEYDEIDSKLKSSKSPELTKLVIHLGKAVGRPIASITGRSGSDIKRVVRILTTILKNNEVTIGNKTLSTKGNSIAMKFAENLMAKKLVVQANMQISANFSSAFSIALIVIAIWAESPSFGDIFMAHLQSKCMYAVPRYHKLTATGGSDEEQLQAMGYEISNGQIEEQDKYLRRMSGLIRLYAAIIQSPLPPGVSRHPHGLAKGWQWLAELLNMEPITDITTTILYNFLEVAGHELMNSYKTQFEKLLFVICHDFYPKLEAVAEDKASVKRLKIFLEKCVKDKRFPTPEGRLDKGFWKTYHSGEVVGE